MGNISTHFDLQEFVPKELYDQFGMNSIWFLDPRLINLAEFIRLHFDASMVINNWSYATGKVFNERGYRMPNTETGGKLSQHKFGRAIDFNIVGLTPIEVSDEIAKNYQYFFPYGLTTMENPEKTPTWTHVDCRNTGLNHLLVVNP